MQINHMRSTLSQAFTTRSENRILSMSGDDAVVTQKSLRAQLEEATSRNNSLIKSPLMVIAFSRAPHISPECVFLECTSSRWSQCSTAGALSRGSSRSPNYIYNMLIYYLPPGQLSWQKRHHPIVASSTHCNITSRSRPAFSAGICIRTCCQLPGRPR